jgi:2-amino-4-hydroxy-6-hydroxymethyldihydropteridine diphosphokinase
VIALPADVIAIGIGGNVGGDDAVRARFVRAREALAEIGEVRSAPLYRTAPIGPEQPMFLNSAIRLRAPAMQPGELVTILQMIESMLGRDRANEVRWGPRTLDLDVLLWGTRTIATPELVVPHPRMTERRFVLAPLLELFGGELLVGEQTLDQWIRAIPDDGVDEIMTSW